VLAFHSRRGGARSQGNFTVLAAAAVGYYALSSGLIPANADTELGQIEMLIAGRSLQATLDKNAPKVPK